MNSGGIPELPAVGQAQAKQRHLSAQLLEAQNKLLGCDDDQLETVQATVAAVEAQMQVNMETLRDLQEPSAASHQKKVSRGDSRSPSPDHLRGSTWRGRLAAETEGAVQSVNSSGKITGMGDLPLVTGGERLAREWAASATSESYLDSLRSAYEARISKITQEERQGRLQAEALLEESKRRELAAGAVAASKRQYELQFEKQRASEAEAANRLLLRRLEQAELEVSQHREAAKHLEVGEEKKTRGQVESCLNESAQRELELQRRLDQMSLEVLQLKHDQEARQQQASDRLTVQPIAETSVEATSNQVAVEATSNQEVASEDSGEMDSLLQQSLKRQRELQASFGHVSVHHIAV